MRSTPGGAKTILRLSLLVALLATLLLSACRNRAGGAADQLLGGLRPARAVAVEGAEKLTNGEVVARGDDWRSTPATVLNGSGAFVEYDLGRAAGIDAAYLQADGNDSYTVSVSDDGAHFTRLWTAEPVPDPGLQPRWAANLGGHGRYVRLAASGGDGRYSVTELALYSKAPSPFPPRFRVVSSAPSPELLRSATLVFGLTLALFALLAPGKSGWWWTLLLAGLPIAGAVQWLQTLALAWPVEPREVSLVRGVAAAVAAVAILREALASPAWPASRHAVLGTLAVCGALAAASFANLGRAQFYDHEHGAPGYVHNFDMRVYYPVAKYFRELRFDGLYEASVAAYIDDDPKQSVTSLGNVALRDLRTHAMVRVRDVAPRIAEVKARFSPARWREFVADMRYFRLTMGTRDYLGSMSDHGGNATPAWFAIAHVLFAFTHASNQTLLITGMLDPLLLGLAFFAIFRTFGARTMLVSLVIFGANDFYMFGTDWFGATLRHDWMAYLALGACALKVRRFKLAGALLGLSALMRAFPIVALVGVAIPALGWLGAETIRRRKLPKWSELTRQHRATLEVAVGALAVGLGMLVVSSILFTPSAWTGWLHKVQMLDSSPHVNHVSLRGLVAGSEGIQGRVLRERMPVFVAGIVAAIVLVIAAARRRPLHQAAILALPLVPVLFNPANYYSHLVFLFPLVVLERRGEAWPLARRDAALWTVMLGMCAAQYGTTLVQDLGLHFYLATALLFLTIAVMLVTLAATETGALAGGALEPVLAGGPSPAPEREPEASDGEARAEAPGPARGEPEPERAHLPDGK